MCLGSDCRYCYGSDLKDCWPLHGVRSIGASLELGVSCVPPVVMELCCTACMCSHCPSFGVGSVCCMICLDILQSTQTQESAVQVAGNSDSLCFDAGHSMREALHSS